MQKNEQRVTFEKTCDLRRVTLNAPVTGGLDAHIEDKRHHGEELFVCQGDVTLREGGLVLRGMGGGAWAAPHLWSGVKNIRIEARVRIDQTGDAPTFGVKFGRVWVFDGAGPRIVFKPDMNRICYSGDEGQGPVGERALALPAGKAFDLQAEYAFDGQRVRVELNGERVMDLSLPHEPFEGFMERYGRPASLTGTGLFASGLTVTVERFRVSAGAPWRRIVAIGDSQTHRHFWVQALERALGESVTNLGIGGDCAALCRLRFERDVVPLKPRICIIFVGSNDVGWGRAPETIASDVEEMALNARRHGIRPLVGEILARRGCKGIAPANAALRAMCERNGVELLRWYEPTLCPGGDELRPGYAPDGCHPVRLGAEAMIRAVNLDVFTKI